MKHILFFLVLLAVLNSLFSLSLAAQTSTQPKLKRVKVYFMVHEPTGKLKSGLNPVTREVGATAPLRPTIEALLAGPTAEEAKRGYEAVDYGRNMKLAAVKLTKGVARIDFTREDGKENPNPGDLLTLYFAGAVKETAKQFPEVRKVIVCVNGLDEFGIGMTKDEAIPCPKENK